MTKKELPKYAKFIMTCRERNCMRQRDLADLVNKSYQIISRWENGINRPSYESAKILSDIFNEPPYKFREE